MDGRFILDKLKGKGAKVIFILGIIGIALIFLSSFIPEKEDSAAKVPSPSEEYCALLEEKVVKIVKSITGSERVSVIITLENGTQYIYADEGKSSEKGEKNDSQQTYAIVRGADGEESGLLVTEYMPTVRGVAIVCDAYTPDAKESVTAAVVAALDISEKKIFVTQYAY